MRCCAIVVALALSAPIAGSAPAAAEDHLRVGIPATESFPFMPVDFGASLGIFQHDGVSVERIILLGGGKLHQGMIADAIDIAVGSGTDFAFLVKGAPEIGIAAMAGPPRLLGFVVPYDSPAHGPDDLRGKLIGTASAGSLTDWLAHRLAQERHWAPDDLRVAVIGADKTTITAALVTHQLDAAVTASALGFELAETQRGRLLLSAATIAGDFVTYAIFATDKIVQDNPNAVREFLKGWFETIAYMRAHRDETIAYAVTAVRRSAGVEAQEYDTVMPMYSADGKFPASGLAVVRRSFVEMRVFDSEPDLTKYYTEAFLPETK
jgi:ABC-type nitrate/sulfonate/bicarbonate transport system substrate-binding protein